MHALEKLEPAQLKLLAVCIQYVLHGFGDLRLCRKLLELLPRFWGETKDRSIDRVDFDVLHTRVILPERVLGEGNQYGRFGD